MKEVSSLELLSCFALLFSSWIVCLNTCSLRETKEGKVGSLLPSIEIFQILFPWTNSILKIKASVKEGYYLSFIFSSMVLSNLKETVLPSSSINLDGFEALNPRSLELWKEGM